MQVPDKISAFLGAPPNHWKKSEVQQIKQIHHCYRNAFNVRNLEDNRIGYVNVVEQPDFALQYNKSQAVQRVPGTKNLTKNEKLTSNGDAISNEVTPGEKARQEAEGDKRDEEWYLPKDSPLRSKDGDKKAPLNPTFKDFEAFEKSCEFDFWREHFEGQSQDRFLSEVAETIVANICNAQSRHELRVMNGNIPLRKRREHITPLALMLHEMKLWATNVLRGASVFEEDTYKELKYRVQYLEGLSHKEVWGDAAVVLGAGMRSIAHEKLFRLLLTTKEALERAHEYAYRGFCRRSSREKLARLGNLLKNTVLREMRILSGIMTLDKKLSDPKTKRLQPTDLLNSIQNQSFVDYKNMVNVLMYRLCNIPLVKAALTSDYEGADVKKELAELEQWTERNLFCVPNTDGIVDEPFFLLDVESKEAKFLPKAYRETAVKLKKLIKAVDPRAPVPLAAKDHAKLLISAFESEDAAKSVVKLMMKNAAAIQELIPMIYVIHQLWGIAGDGGDFTVYDTLREQVIVVMSTAVAKVKAVQETEKVLLKEIGDLSKVKEKNMELRQLKTGTPKYKPAWIMNFKFLHTDLLPASSKGHNELIKQLFEVAEDAWRYNLTSEELDDKIESCKKMVDAVSGEKFLAVKKGAEEEAKSGKKGKRFEGEFNVAEVVKAGNKKDWLYSNERSGDDQFGKNDAFGAGALSTAVALTSAPVPDSTFKFENDKFDFEKEDSEEGPDKYNPFAATNGSDSDDY